MDKTERIHKVLRDRIFSGFYWPRQRLIEGVLSEELGVNRFVVRDVLKRLTAEKIVVSERYRGSFVAEISAEDAFETYQVEAFLEGAAAFLATDRIEEGELKKIADLIDMSKELGSGDLEKWTNCNREIHRKVNTVCGNGKLIDLIADNVKFMKYWFITLSRHANVAKRNREHALILKALQERNATKVRQAVEDHIIEAGMDMRKSLESLLPTVHRGNVPWAQK